MTRLEELHTMLDFINREIREEERRNSRILQRVAALYEVTIDDLLGRSQGARIARARHGAAWLLRQDGMTCRGIADMLGYREHTSVLHAVHKVDRDPATRALLLGLEVVA
jgi:chromosomal replication initiation ATPase DnaA